MMDLVRRMESWLSGRRSASLLLAALLILAAPGVCAAQPASASDADALNRLANEAAAKGLPAAPLTNKIREGLAKNVDPKRIELVVRQMATNLETADQLIREFEPAPGGPGRDLTVTLLAEAIGDGVTPGEVRELRRLAQPVTSESLASAAKGLSLIKGAQLPVADGTAVMAEAVRQRFRSVEILDLGREVKRRETDYRTGRASLQALRDAIARGDRPEQLFPGGRPNTVERPTPARPEPTVERPERPIRPEPPQRPEQPVRPERPATGPAR